MDALLGIYYLQKYFPKILINHQKYNVSYTCNGLFFTIFFIICKNIVSSKILDNMIFFV